MRKWQIFEMLTGNHKLDFMILRKARKKDLLEAIIEYVMKRGK